MTLKNKRPEYLRAFLDKEKNKPIIFIARNRNAVELRLEMVGIIRALHSDLVKVDIVHLSDKVLPIDIAPHAVKHLDGVCRCSCLRAEFLYRLNKGSHFPQGFQKFKFIIQGSLK